MTASKTGTFRLFLFQNTRTEDPFACCSVVNSLVQQLKDHSPSVHISSTNYCQSWPFTLCLYRATPTTLIFSEIKAGLVQYKTTPGPNIFSLWTERVMYHWGRTCATGTKMRCILGPNMWVSQGPGSELGDCSNKCSLSVTRRSLWSKQKRMWRRSLVRPSVCLSACLSVCDVVQETKQFVDCHQSRHWRILQDRLSFELRANGLKDSSTLHIWVHFSAADHMHWHLWAVVTSSKWVQWLQNKSVSVFSTFTIYFTKRGQRACARKVLSDCEFSDSAMHRKLSCTEGRKWISFCTFRKYSGNILRKAFVLESFTCCLRFVPVKLPHYLFTFPESVLPYK